MNASEQIELARRPTRTSTWVWCGVAVVGTLGILLPVFAVLLLLAWLLDDSPKSFDREGLLTRRRRRVRWADVTEANWHTEYLRRGTRQVPVRSYVRIGSTQGKRVHFQPDLFANGDAAIGFLERMLGRDLGRPA